MDSERDYERWYDHGPGSEAFNRRVKKTTRAAQETSCSLPLQPEVVEWIHKVCGKTGARGHLDPVECLGNVLIYLEQQEAVVDAARGVLHVAGTGELRAALTAFDEAKTGGSRLSAQDTAATESVRHSRRDRGRRRGAGMRIEVLRCVNPAGPCRHPGLAISVNGAVVKGSCGGPYEVVESVDAPFPKEVAALAKLAPLVAEINEELAAVVMADGRRVRVGRMLVALADAFTALDKVLGSAQAGGERQR